MYPAQSFKSFSYPNFEYKNKDFYKSLKANERYYYYHIERNHDDYFGGDNQVTTYFHKMVGFEKGDTTGIAKTLGVVGFQMRQSDFNKLLPSPVLEEPYPLSFIVVQELDGTIVYKNIVDDQLTNEVFEASILQDTREFYRKKTEVSSMTVYDAADDSRDVYRTFSVMSPIDDDLLDRNALSYYL